MSLRPMPGADITGGDDALATVKAFAETPDAVWALWALAPLSADIGIESIIGADERTKVTDTTVYPQRAMVLITTSTGRCSGTMINPNTVLTAGHCVHGGGSTGAWKSNVRVYPGRNGPLSPFGSCGSRTLYSVVGWVRDRNELYDYGVIKLDCSIGNTVGWLGIWWQSASLVGIEAIIEGYPGDKPLEQWRSKGTVRVSDGFQIFYQNDTMPGNSGSSVYSTTVRILPRSLCDGDTRLRRPRSPAAWRQQPRRPRHQTSLRQSDCLDERALGPAEYPKPCGKGLLNADLF